METVKFILNGIIFLALLISIIWLFWRELWYVKSLKGLSENIHSMVEEAKGVRDELQTIFDEFKQTIENEMNDEAVAFFDGKGKEFKDSDEFKGIDNEMLRIQDIDGIAKYLADEDKNAEYCEQVFENEPTKCKYLIRVKSEYFRRKFPDFDAMSEQQKDDLMAKEFEYMTSILNGRSGKLAIFFNEDFKVDEWSDDVEIFPLEDSEKVKMMAESGFSGLKDEQE